MDVISHSLWGAIAFGRKSRAAFLWAFGFGVLPDVGSFGALTLMRLAGLAHGPDWSQGVPSEGAIPHIVHSLYNITHSIIICATILLLVTLFCRKIFWPMFAWPLHILIDIPTHSLRFFATPFLWPLSSYRFDGTGWSSPFIFVPNLLLLATAYVLVFLSRGQRRARPARPGSSPAWREGSGEQEGRKGAENPKRP